MKHYDALALMMNAGTAKLIKNPRYLMTWEELNEILLNNNIQVAEEVQEALKNALCDVYSLGVEAGYTIAKNEGEKKHGK
jgi:uncharacterized phage infection (PIP) family protein YhgE